MPIGKILAIDVNNRKMDVRVYSTKDDFIARNVELTDAVPGARNCPKPDDLVRIVKDGGIWYSTGYLWKKDLETVDSTGKENLVAGDIVLGEMGAPMLTLYRGGMVTLMADPMTGILADKTTSTVNLTGKNIAQDSPLYHSEINSKSAGARIYKKAWDPAGLKSVEKLIDLETGEISKKCEGVTDVSISMNQASLMGSNVSIDIKSMAGNISLTVDGTTGNIKLNTPGSINITGMTIGFNTGDIPMPLQGVVTGETICPYTGGPHVDCSRTVFSKKV